MKKIILASSSPRRAEILKNLNLDFEVVPSNFEESILNMPPSALVCHLAHCKAVEVASRVEKDSIIIAADTVVYKDGTIIGKPKSRDEAFRILNLLSGSQHNVITGLCVVQNSDNIILEDHEDTEVYFRDLSEIEINDYIDTGEPVDKAGGYGIQGLGGVFVKKINGCYFNVVGLPVYKLGLILRDLGVNILKKEVQYGK
jgi:septum formation protein